MNILFFVADGMNEYNSSRWRASAFYNMINRVESEHKSRIAPVSSWLKQDELGVSLCEWADIISIQRVGIDKTVELATKWRNREKAVVIDYDDDYFRINRSNAAYKFWGKGKADVRVADGHTFESVMTEHPISQFARGLKAVTGATMPSRLLAKDAKAFTKSWFLPNFIEGFLYPQPNEKLPDYDEVVIGWGGSLSHIESFEHSGVIGALRKLLNEKDYVKILIVGDDRVVNKLSEHGIRREQIKHHPYVPYDRWYKTLMLYDVGIAPLAQEYDMRRSWIKVAEYMSMGIPFVATRGAPYDEEVMRDCSYGAFVEQGDLDKCDIPNESMWYEALTWAVEQQPGLKAIALDNYTRHYDYFNIYNNSNNIFKIFQDIIESEVS